MRLRIDRALAGVVLGGLFCVVAAGDETAPLRLEEVRVLALAPLDGQAVVQLPHEPPQVVEVGSELPGTQATLLEVLADRLVVEETSAGELGRIRRAWVYRASRAGKRSRVQYLDHEPPPEPPLQKPVVIPIELPGIDQDRANPPAEPEEGGGGS